MRFPFVPTALAWAAALALVGPARAQAPASPLVPAVATEADAAALSAELALSRQIRQAGADLAWGRGLTGRGVVVALLDTGLQPSAEFAGRVLAGFNALDGSTRVADGNGHGTHVAGLVAAARDGVGTVGLAPGASLLPVKVLGDGGLGSGAAIDAGLRWAAARAPILNLSLAAPSPKGGAGMRDAVAAGALVVAAAGNDGLPNPGWPARYAKETWARGQILAVGAVDANNVIARFSNRAGDTAPWFLVAPGVGVVSTFRSGYAQMSGTSQAAPTVSAAAALVKELWPRLTAAQVAQLLLATATDLGAPGIDAVYGQGLLNVDRALQPLGHVTGWDGLRRVQLARGLLAPSPATAAVYGLARDGALRTTGWDAWDRDFTANLGGGVARPRPRLVEDAFGAFNARMELTEQVRPDGSRVAAAVDDTPLDARALAGPASAEPALARARRLAAFSLVQRRGPSELAAGLGMAQTWLGAGGLALDGAPSLAGVGALAHPHFGLVRHAAHLGYGWRWGGTTVKAARLSSALADAAAAQYGAGMRAASAGARLLELSHDFGPAALALSWSDTRERGAVLGAAGSGTLALGPGAATRALQLSGALRLAPQTVLAAQLAVGRTPGLPGGDGLMGGLGPMATRGAGVALVHADTWRPGDRLALSLSQPLRAQAGWIDIRTTGADDQGLPVPRTTRYSMVPGGRERLAEASYTRPAGPGAWVSALVSLRAQPNHQADAPAEAVLGMRYGAQF